MPATGCRDRHARVHQGERRAADRGHGARTVRFQNVADDAHGVGERFVVGNDGGESALGQSSVADFAAARAAHEAHFADAERREVVVQHEALGGFRGIQQLDALLVVLGAERGGDQRLRFAAGEQRRAVGARQHADFDVDLADFVELAAVRTAAVLQHLVAEDALLQAIEQFLGFGLLFFGERLRGFCSCGRRCASSFRASRTSGCSSRPSARRGRTWRSDRTAPD